MKIDKKTTASLVAALLVGASASWAALTVPIIPADKKMHYICTWTVVMNSELPPTTDPYTGEQQTSSVAKQKRILKILWHGWKTKAEAEAFKAKAPAEVQKTFHIDTVDGGFDE